jgi:hypothetical protein
MIQFFNHKSILSNNTEWTVTKAEIDFGGPLFSKAKQQAQLKSIHTMAANQAGVYRSPELKYNKQLMGTLAEICVQTFLELNINKHGLDKDWRVERYDDIRTDNFTSSQNEFDIKAFKIINHTKSYKIETRSSIVKDRSLVSAIESFHIIGAYSSIAKMGEGENDFYILPLHLYTNQSIPYLPSQYEKKLIKGEIEFYIVAGCTNTKLQSKGYVNNLQQGATQFRLLRASHADDSQSFINEFISILNPVGK